MKRPDYKVIYNGNDITRTIRSEVISLTYIDRVEGESDELEIILEDNKARWRNASWYPKKMDKLELFLGWTDDLVPAGSFEIDEVRTNWNGSGFTLSIKALAVIISAPFRTKRRQRYDNLNLRKLANTVAQRGGLTVSGEIENIPIKSIAQVNETDLGFLRRVSTQFGYIFSIKSGKLVFSHIGKLQTKSSVYTLKPTDISEIDLTDTTSRTFKKARLKYKDPITGKTIEYEAESKTSDESNSDTIELRGYVENEQQAELVAKAAIQKSENAAVYGTASVSRSVTNLLAGNNLEIVGIGVTSGLFHIESSTHVITKSGGYSISIDVFRVGLVDTSRH